MMSPDHLSPSNELHPAHPVLLDNLFQVLRNLAGDGSRVLSLHRTTSQTASQGIAKAPANIRVDLLRYRLDRLKRAGIYHANSVGMEWLIEYARDCSWLLLERWHG
jgi:hypothetical protein